MGFAIIILLVAASPIILLLVFSEIMAAKEGSKLNDNPRKISKILGWVFFILLSIFLIYVATSEQGNPRALSSAIKLINSFFEFLK